MSCPLPGRLPKPGIEPRSPALQADSLPTEPLGKPICHSVQSLSSCSNPATPWTAAGQASLSITKSRLAQTHVQQVGDANQPSHPLSSPTPPALKLSQIRVFSNESALHISWPKYWSISFSIFPSIEYSGLFFFRIDWFDFLAVQRTFKTSPAP